MPFRRFLQSALLACVAPLATLPIGSWSSPPSTSAPAPAPAGDHPDPAALRVLESALILLHPERLGWLETTLWQRTNVRGLVFEAQGRYVAGPNQRLLMDLTTRVGATEGALRIVSDGSTLWKAMRIGSGTWNNITCVKLGQVLAALPPGAVPDQVWDEFLQGESFGGIFALLGMLQRQMTWVHTETVRRGGRELIKLTGVRRADSTGFFRRCYLYLDPHSFWPHRLEWWGEDPPRQGELLLVQMEFRSPVFHRPPPDSKFQEFSFDPGPLAVQDQTGEVTARLQARLEQLAR
jgi:hypothetical protein